MSAIIYSTAVKHTSLPRILGSSGGATTPTHDSDRLSPTPIHYGETFGFRLTGRNHTRPKRNLRSWGPHGPLLSTTLWVPSGRVRRLSKASGAEECCHASFAVQAQGF